MEENTTESQKNETGAVTLNPGQVIRPCLSANYAKQICKELFGLKVKTIKEFNSYDDRNFHITVEEEWDNPHIKEIYKDGYMMKVLNSMDSKKTHYEGEHLAMKILDANGINCPLPVLNIYGQESHLQRIYIEENENEVDPQDPKFCEHKGFTENIVRLLKFVPGQIIWTVPYVPDLLYNAGKLLGKLQKCLKDFHHSEMQEFKSVWNTGYFPEVAKFVYVIKDEEDNKMILDIIQAFKEQVLPVSKTLQRGVIHGDFNEQNILVKLKDGKRDEYEICGMLDFGDMSESCYIYEVGMAIMYLMVESKVVPFMEVGGHVLAGYLSQMRLSRQEYNLVWLCVAARYATSLTMGAYSYTMDPGNEYLLVTAKNGWPQLRKFWSTPKEEIYAMWEKVIDRYEKQT